MRVIKPVVSLAETFAWWILCITPRSENIIKTLGAKTVSENIAYNYNTPEAVLSAWLASPSHKANIEGDHTHFGIAIKENPANGRKYYTNIFAKI